MSFAMNRHTPLYAQVTVPNMTLLDLGEEDIKDMIKHRMTEILAKELLKFVTIERGSSNDTFGTTFTSSIVISKTEDYKYIVDNIRKNDYRILDENGNFILLSDLL